jgi:hypothetical protein
VGGHFVLPGGLKRTLGERAAMSALCQKETNGIAAIYTPSCGDLALRTRKTENLLWTN